jgi:hypothetical protein
MKSLQNPMRIVAAVLVVISLLSAYGLYQTMYNWAEVQEARLTSEGRIKDVTLRFIDGGHAVLSADFVVDNPSGIDVQLVEISFYAYAGTDPGAFADANFIGLGSHSYIDSPDDGLVEAEGSLETSASLGIQNGTLYMDKLRASYDNGAYPIQLRAVIRFELRDFPDIDDKMGTDPWVEAVYAS